MTSAEPVALCHFACPSCKQLLADWYCAQCQNHYSVSNGVGRLLSDSSTARQYAEIGKFYDELYARTQDTWEEIAGRGEAFNEYVGGFISRLSPGRYLDIGCGKGHLLAKVLCSQRCGIDVSQEALTLARQKAGASVSVAMAEELPFANNTFDVVSSIGVMTHFIDDIAATREINRVLRKEGHYVLGIFIPPTRYQRFLTKYREYVWPSPKPLEFAGWAWDHLRKTAQTAASGTRKESQPVERCYSEDRLRAVFKATGFVEKKLIAKWTDPSAPLAGAHFRIYILQKM